MHQQNGRGLREIQSFKVLLDCRKISGNTSVMDRFEVAEYGATKKQELRQLALVNRKDVVLPDNVVENVAVNRGMNRRSLRTTM